MTRQLKGADVVVGAAGLAGTGVSAGQASAWTTGLARVDPGVTGAERQSLQIIGGVPAWGDPGVFVVTAAGVRSTNTAAQNTTALQALCNSIRAGTSPVHTLFFPEGRYLISSAILVNLFRIRIQGAGRWRTQLYQETANTSILKWDSANTPVQNYWDWTSDAPAKGIDILDIGFEFATQPTSTTTQQYAIQLRPNASGNADNATGYAYFNIHRCLFRKSYVGVGVWSDTLARLCPVWNSSFRDLLFIETKHIGIDLHTGPSGNTSNVFDGITCSNWSRDAVGGVANDGPAIYADSLNGSIFNAINIETWQGTAIQLEAGFGNQFGSLRLEQHKIATAGVVIILSGAATTIGSIGFQSLNLANAAGTIVHLVYLYGSGNEATVGDLFVEHLTGTGIAAAYGGDVGARLKVGKPQLSGNVSEYHDSGNGSYLYARTSVDGLPPRVNALPVASVAYRGRQFRTEGGTGVADVTSECRKASDGTYSWVAL